MLVTIPSREKININSQRYQPTSLSEPFTAVLFWRQVRQVLYLVPTVVDQKSSSLQTMSDGDVVELAELSTPSVLSRQYLAHADPGVTLRALDEVV